MITQKILELGVFLLELVVGAIPLPQPPDWLVSPSGAVATVFQGAAALGVWFPTTLVLTVLGGVIAARITGLAVRVGRMVLSLVTGGGGNAGG